MRKGRPIRVLVQAAAEKARGPVALDASQGDAAGAGPVGAVALTSSNSGRTRKSFVIGIDVFSDHDAVFE